MINGSNFNDTLVGSDRNEVFRGLNGNDLIAALGGDDFIEEGSAPNGADQLGELRKVELRLSRNGAPAGEVTIRPRTGRISAGGAVNLVREQTRLTRRGKTVTARLALRLDDSLAGQTLAAEVEATDTRGRRQLQRDAGSIRIVD